MSFSIPDLHQTTSDSKGKYETCFTSSNHLVFLLKLTCQTINCNLKHPVKQELLRNATLVSV